MSDPKIKYDIEAAVKGEQSVEALASKRRELGDVLEGDLQQSAHAAAGELDALGSKQRAVENFSALKRETHDLSASMRPRLIISENLALVGPRRAHEPASMRPRLITSENLAAVLGAALVAWLQ